MSTNPAATCLAVCLKWTALGGEPAEDARFAGTSDSDRAALEVALRIGAQLSLPVVAISLGPPAADAALRDAVACGASQAVRIDVDTDALATMPSQEVARQLARHLRGAAIVLCGDMSADRGSGSVPAYLAHHLRAAQALGLVAVELQVAPGGAADSHADAHADAHTDWNVGTHGGTHAAARPDAHVEAVRRLDGGRRERLRVPIPCVVSVEGSVATLRRAGLRAALAARSAPVDVVAPAPPAHDPVASSHVSHHPVATLPLRPRARSLPPPRGDDPLARVRALTDAHAAGPHGETVTLDPPAAAARIVQALGEWGYLPHG